MSRFRLELVDGGLALALACLAEVQLAVYAECCGAGRVAPAAFLLTLGQTLLVAGRRRFPLVTFFLVGSAAIAQLLLGGPITDFGTFSVRDSAARTGRNPQTGETIQIPARRVPS